MPPRKTLLILAAVVVAYFLFMREDVAQAAAPAPAPKRTPAPDTGAKTATPRRAAYKPPSQGTTAQTVMPDASQAAQEARALAAFNQTEGWAN